MLSLTSSDIRGGGLAVVRLLLGSFSLISLRDLISYYGNWLCNIIRSGSRINTDRFPKRAPKQARAWPGEGWGGGAGGVVKDMLPGKFIFGILTFKSPLFWISESFRQDIGKFQWLLLLSKPVVDIRRVCSARSRALTKCSPNLFVPIYYHTIYQISTWKVFLLKVYLFMKHLTDFRKTLETGVDPRLIIFRWKIDLIWTPLQLTLVARYGIKTIESDKFFKD